MDERTHYEAEILLGSGGCLLLKDQYQSGKSRLGAQIRQGTQAGGIYLYSLLLWT